MTRILLAALLIVACSAPTATVTSGYWHGIVRVDGKTVTLTQQRGGDWSFAYGGYDAEGVRQRLENLLETR